MCTQGVKRRVWIQATVAVYNKFCLLGFPTTHLISLDCEQVRVIGKQCLFDIDCQTDVGNTTQLPIANSMRYTLSPAMYVMQLNILDLRRSFTLDQYYALLLTLLAELGAWWLM